MPRQKRRLSRSKIYHVMIRGNEKKKIFLDDEDRTKFIDILLSKGNNIKYLLYAYCLMDNHVHILINEVNDSISAIMKSINVRYAYYFNKKYGRIGHLFQDRFKSEAVENEAYLLAAVRYIHNNPVKANIAIYPYDYKWSSYHLYSRRNKYEKIIETDYILDIFAEDKDKAIKLFAKFTNQSNDDNFIEYIENGNIERSIIGEKEARLFVLGFLNERNMSLENIKDKSNSELRDKLILYLKDNSTLSNVQIAGILSLDKNIIQRVK